MATKRAKAEIRLRPGAIIMFVPTHLEGKMPDNTGHFQHDWCARDILYSDPRKHI